MAKYKNPDYPEEFNTPIRISGEEPCEGLVPFIEKLVALKEYYGVDWDALAIHLAVDNLEGFQLRQPIKRGKKAKPEDIADDIRLFVEMTKAIETSPPDVTEEAIAYSVFEQHPDLGNTGDAVYQRWKLLKRNSKERQRMTMLIKKISDRRHLPG